MDILAASSWTYWQHGNSMPFFPCSQTLCIIHRQLYHMGIRQVNSILTNRHALISIPVFPACMGFWAGDDMVSFPVPTDGPFLPGEGWNGGGPVMCYTMCSISAPPTSRAETLSAPVRCHPQFRPNAFDHVNQLVGKCAAPKCSSGSIQE